MKQIPSALKSNIKEISLEILACICIAVGVYNFAAASDFPLTGFSGIALILNHFFLLPVGLGILLLNIPVSILCFRLLGRSFFMRSLFCMILSSVMIDVLAPMFPSYTGSRMLSALCCGTLGGLGYAIVYMQHSSTGGMDFIVLTIKKLKPYLSLGKIVFVVDIGIVVIGGILFEDPEGIVYGIIISFLYAVIADKLIYGINSGKLALIVTDHAEETVKAIDSSCRRGSTIFPAMGAYQKKEKQVVMCACSSKEMYFVQKAVKQADPSAFLIILVSSEVHGEGFRMLQIGETNKSRLPKT